MTTPAGSWRTSHKPAVIVAESLRRVPGPPFAAPPPPHPSPGAVASAIAHGLTPPLAQDPPPAWLLPGQTVSFARALAAIRRHGAALIADPVGSGKTWIALALAQTVAGRAVAIVPAALREQWERAARRAGVELIAQTHEQWSRARRPIPAGLIVVDEAHWYRHADIKRYAHLAPALVHRAGVLLTATPVVNRLDDVVNQLLLLARDDALAGAGVASIREALSHDRPPPQLAELIITGSESGRRPIEQARQLEAGSEEEAQARAVFTRLDRLVLSGNRAVRSLLAGVFAAAWGSSPAALRATLSRYRTLLLHQSDAAEEGLRLGRHQLHRLLGRDLEQTVLWQMMGETQAGCDLVAGDLPALDDCLAWLRELEPANDPKVRRLRSVLEDGSRSIVFTTARATVGHLRRVLTPTSRIAWCTGAEAGIGATRLARAEVLNWFGPEAPEHELAPQTLVATDVAAEGLDLQRARRIVHYDLPWTTVRLDQRAGRVVRLGSRHVTADVVTLLPPTAVEARLNLLERLARKRPLPSRLGLGAFPEPAWRWRAELARRWEGAPWSRGSVVIEGELDAAVAGVELTVEDEVLTTFAVARRGRQGWSSDHGLIDELLECALQSHGSSADSGAIAAAARSVQRVIRAALLGATGSLWRIRPLSGWDRAALARLRLLAADAVRRRDMTRLAFADRAISFLRRGHTAGERYLALRLAQAPERELVDLLGELPPPDPLPLPVRAHITGLIVFRSGRR